MRKERRERGRSNGKRGEGDKREEVTLHKSWQDIHWLIPSFLYSATQTISYCLPAMSTLRFHLVASAAVSTVIRALALKQVAWKDVRWVVLMESVSGMLMGAALGAVVLVGSTFFDSVGWDIGVVVFVSLPIVSLWANLLGAFLPLVSAEVATHPLMHPRMSPVEETVAIVSAMR